VENANDSLLRRIVRLDDPEENAIRAVAASVKELANLPFEVGVLASQRTASGHL